MLLWLISDYATTQMKHGKMTVILETALPKLIAGGKNGAKGISLIELLNMVVVACGRAST